MSKYRLLVVEDDQGIADLVSRIATEADFEVCVTCDSTKILSLYDEFSPHVMVLDIMMPEMDGFEVLNFLSQRKSSTRVIILSGKADYRRIASRMAEARELAIVATVAKPFRLEAFRQTLEKVTLSLPARNRKPTQEAV